jgi:membrane-associated protease RseP (regulator of RpoE activity)
LRRHMEQMLKDLDKQLQGQGVPKEALEELRKAMEGLKGQGMLIPNVPNVPNMPNVVIPNIPNMRVIPNVAMPGNPFAAGREPNAASRLGARVERPTAALVEQLDLPKDSGIVVTDVIPDSAAAKAGLKANDIVLEIGGQPARSEPREFIQQVGELKANSSLSVVVLRKGRKETLKGLSLPEARSEAPAAEPAPFLRVQPNIQIQPGELRLNPNIQIQPGQMRINPRAFQGAGGEFRIQPNLQFDNLPAIPGGRGTSMSTTVRDGAFTTEYRDGSLKVTLKGQIEDGKARPSSIVIDDDGQKSEASSLDKVPAKHKELVEKLLKGIGGGGGAFRLQIDE